MISMHFVKKIFWNYIYSGQSWEPALSRQISFINSFSLIGFSATLGFGIYRIVVDEPNGYVELFFAFLCAINVLYLRKSLNTNRASEILLLLMVGIISFLFIEGGIAGTGLFWAFTFPILAFFLFDDEIGLRWNIGLVLVLMAITMLHELGIVVSPYEPVVLRQAFFSFLAQVGLLFFYTKFTGINAKILQEKSKELERVFSVKKLENEEWAHGVQRALKEKLDIFFQTGEGLMCLVNKEGYFIEVNPAFTRILGYSVADFLKLPFIEFVHPDDHDKTKQSMDVLVSGGHVENIMNRYRREDGVYIWLRWNAVLHNGVIYATAHVVDDLMSVQKNLEMKVADLEKLNRLMVDRELAMIEMKKELATLRTPK